MPNISVQLRRGTDTEHSSFTGAEGEVTVDTTNDTLRVHDGTTAGGIRLAKLSEAGGSGTVTSVDSGTGLTGGPITTSGTLSLASIADLRVLGNVSGVSAAPVAVEIKDEDAMTSNSATALATQQSIKAYVDANTVSKYSSGWFNNTTGLANGGTHNFTHNLGTTDLTVTIWVADDSSGTNPKEIRNYHNPNGGNVYGATINDVSNTTLQLQLLADGWFSIDSNGDESIESWSGHYVKVVVTG